jgi:hypothetical protein
MNLTLTINSQDYGFVIEAIKLRTGAILESLDVQKKQQEGTILQNAPHPESAEKKPHWTQTAKGRKIMAARKTKGTK